MYYVYALFNNAHNKIYIGQTKNLEERLNLHKNKIFQNGYTARFNGDWDLIYKEKTSDRKEALKREKQLKSYRGRQFIKSLINIPQ